MPCSKRRCRRDATSIRRSSSSGYRTTLHPSAEKHKLALVGVRLTDKPHDQGFIEEYVNVSQGSGQAFLDAMTAFATRARHPELATAPFLLWGMSAGGEFNYEFVCWKPERVVAFVVNKGNIYYTALAPASARQVPGVLFTGGKDLEFRTSTVDDFGGGTLP